MAELLKRASDITSPWIEPLMDRLIQYGLSAEQAKIAMAMVGTGAGGYLTWSLLGKRYNLPPGPRSFPIVGSMLNMPKSDFAWISFAMLKDEYGDICKIQMGPITTIVLNSAQLVREAYIKDDLAYADRPHFNSLDLLSNYGQDIIAAQFGPRLQMQRKLALGALRKFAHGNALETHLQKSFECFCNEVDKVGTFVPFKLGYLVAYNILASMAFGKHFKFDDPFMKEMMQIQLDLEKSFTSPLAFLYVMPFMKYYPSEVMRHVRKFAKVFNVYIKKNYKEHIDNYDEDKLTDFTYHFIHTFKEAEQDPNEQNKMKLLTDENFEMIILDLFLAGTDTTRQTLAWIWQYLAAFPEVQRKAQEEVDRVIGKDGKVTVNSREQLPYVDAVLHEVMRIKPVVATGVPRQVRFDTKLGGYDIPKGTMVMNNTWAIHHDEREWKDPEAFLPERWLDEQGKYHFQQNGFLPFSVGRRSCVGESFAKLELHMLTAMMLQRYTLGPEQGKRINLDPMPGGVVRSYDQNIVVQKRS